VKGHVLKQAFRCDDLAWLARIWSSGHTAGVGCLWPRLYFAPSADRPTL